MNGNKNRKKQIWTKRKLNRNQHVTQGNFLDELDVLLSTFPEDGTPLVMLGDFNIHMDKPEAADFHTLLASFDLKRVLTMATHKSGNQLGLIYT